MWKGEYVYVPLLGHRIDMDGIKMLAYTPNHAEGLEPSFVVGSVAGAAANAFLQIDDVIITVDEP